MPTTSASEAVSVAESVGLSLTTDLRITASEHVTVVEALHDQSVEFVHDSGIASTATVGRPTVTRTGLGVFPAGIPSTAAVGSLTVGFGGAAQYVTPVGWAEADTVGHPTVTHTAAGLSVPSIPSTATVGVPFVLLGTVARSVPRNLLIDRLTREVYPWPLNHATEDAVKTLGRRLTRSGVSASGHLTASRNVFLIRQPTHPGPMHLILHGSLIDRSLGQYHAFVRFFDECDDRTFDYIDASGDSYHIAIVNFDARRVLSPARVDGSFFTYTLEVEVIDVNQGAYRGYAR